ncbi:MAG: MotA/TolQ/ExbB proton channel family protein [Clostridium sp.]|nr:MotA/TolQ/ExbB proton channel family protein [Clostridium sp.]
MELISKTLFWISNSMLIPDIVLLIALFLRALLLIGGTYNTFIIKRRNDRKLDEAIRTLTPSTADALTELLPRRNNSLFIAYLRELLAHRHDEDYADYLLSRFETEAAKDTALPRMLSKMGPILGLVGTLISMSPALVGLSTGDISGMAYNMQVVFATTVVGLVISSVGLITLQLKQRWFARELNSLDYVARVINREKEEALS